MQLFHYPEYLWCRCKPDMYSVRTLKMVKENNRCAAQQYAKIIWIFFFVAVCRPKILGLPRRPPAV